MKNAVEPTDGVDPRTSTTSSAKHKFSNSEKFAVWRAYNCVCFWCGHPLGFREAEVDHIIAESLAKNADEFSALLQSLGLPPEFNVNDFMNWVPACRGCNGRKRIVPDFDIHRKIRADIEGRINVNEFESPLTFNLIS